MPVRRAFCVHRGRRWKVCNGSSPVSFLVSSRTSGVKGWSNWMLDSRVRAQSGGAFDLLDVSAIDRMIVLQAQVWGLTRADICKT